MAPKLFCSKVRLLRIKRGKTFSTFESILVQKAEKNRNIHRNLNDSDILQFYSISKRNAVVIQKRSFLTEMIVILYNFATLLIN